MRLVMQRREMDVPVSHHRGPERYAGGEAVVLHVVYGDVLAERDHRDRLAEVENRNRIKAATAPGARRPALRSGIVGTGELAMRMVASVARIRERRVAPAPALTSAEPDVCLTSDDVARV